jgi:hypothetical protein
MYNYNNQVPSVNNAPTEIQHNSQVISKTTKAEERHLSKVHKIVEFILHVFLFVKNDSGSFLIKKEDFSVWLLSDERIYPLINANLVSSGHVLDRKAFNDAVDQVRNYYVINRSDSFLSVRYANVGMRTRLQTSRLNIAMISSNFNIVPCFNSVDKSSFISEVIHSDPISSIHDYIKGWLLSIGISVDQYLVVLVWLVSVMAVPNNFYLLALNGNSEQKLRDIQEALKNLVDPADKNSILLSKKESLLKLSLNNHLISLYVKEPFGDGMQEEILDLLKGRASIVLPNEKDPYAVKFNLKRPFVIASKIPVITSESLKGLTIHLTISEETKGENIYILGSVRDYLYSLVGLSNYFNDFYQLGVSICQYFSIDQEVFDNQLNLIEQEKLMAHLRQNPIAVAVSEWSKENLDSSVKKGVSEWMQVLQDYEDEDLQDFPKTAKAMGNLLTEAQPLLEPLGIKIIKNGEKVNGVYHRTIVVPSQIVQITSPLIKDLQTTTMLHNYKMHPL